MQNENNTVTATVRATLLDLDSPHCKSYATEAMLVRKMDEFRVREGRYQIVRTPKGRWTALVVGFRQELVGTGWPMV